MKLFFSDSKYNTYALNANNPAEDDTLLSKENAMLLLFKGVSFNQLDNLLKKIKNYLPDADLNELFQTIQSTEEFFAVSSLNGLDKSLVYKCALECLKENLPFGSETINEGKTNTSDWMNHSLWEGILCSYFAGKAGLDSERAEVLGILHDFGRKKDHSFKHVICGFELLSDYGCRKDAVGCLTHSFVNGGRCASNEAAEEGFFVSDDGLPCWAEGTEKDDVTVFLEQYTYTDYDRILNLSDLMASSYGILSPYDRVQDIATRRVIDPINRGYFLAELIKLINYFSAKMNLPCFHKEYVDIRFLKSDTIDEMTNLLKKVSEEFYSCLDLTGLI